MSKFKVGDSVKVIMNTFKGDSGTVVSISPENTFPVEVDTGGIVNRVFRESELELIPEQKPKTRTVRKYASIIFDKDGTIKETSGFYTEEHLKKVETDYYKGKKIYHIIPTIFEDVEVPVKTETRWTFICKNYRGDYYPTASKYNSLDQAKSHSLGEAIAKIYDSVEEFEI
jgi:ribosomal protein L24